MKSLSNGKMPTKTLVLAVTVVVLGLIYVLQNFVSPERNRIELPVINDEITLIEISNQETTISMERLDEGWSVTDERFPGDVETIDALVESALAVRSVDVISERGGDERFGLHEDEIHRLVLYVGEEAVRAYAFGAVAAAGDRVYGRVQDESAVVLLPGSLANGARFDVDHYRDKVIARIEAETIRSIGIDASGFGELEMQRVDIEADEEDADASEIERLEREWRVLLDGVLIDSAEESDSVAGDVANDDDVNDAAVNTDTASGDTSSEVSAVPGYLRQNLLQELAELRGQEFLPSAPGGEPFARLHIEMMGGGEEKIDLYPPDENWQYPLVTTAGDYVVTIPEFRVRRLLLGRDEYIEQFRAAE